MAVGDRVITPSQDGLTTHWDPLQTAVCPRILHHGTFRSVVWVYLRCSAEISDALRCVGGDASENVHHGAHPSSLRITTEDSGNLEIAPRLRMDRNVQLLFPTVAGPKAQNHISNSCRGRRPTFQQLEAQANFNS